MPLRPPGRPLDVGDGELVGGGLGHPGDQLVGLVDDHHVVVGDHRDALDRVDREQRVVGDDQVAAVRLLARELGEALGAERALRGAQAVAVADADLPPLTVGVPRGAVALAAAAALGLLLGPLPQLEHLLAQSTRGHVDERALVVGDALADPVQAGVVGAALEYGVARVDAVTDRLDQARDVALDQLVLQGQRGRRDHDPPVVQQARDEVAQRLAGAGAGLDEEVLAGSTSRRYRLGHRHLAGPLLAAEGLHRRREHLTDGGAGGGLPGGLARGGQGHLRTLTAPTDIVRIARGAALLDVGPCPRRSTARGYDGRRRCCRTRRAPPRDHARRSRSNPRLGALRGRAIALRRPRLPCQTVVRALVLGERGGRRAVVRR